MVAFFGSTLQMGIETVLDTVGFDKLLEGADMVFSGEGKLSPGSMRPETGGQRLPKWHKSTD